MTSTPPHKPSHRVVGIVKMGAASLVPVSTKVKRNMMNENKSFEAMSRSLIENQ
jgi:hypothetical protein